MVRKLARVAFDVLAAVLLVLCVAACVLWVRSHSFLDQLHWGWDEGQRTEA